MRKTLKFFHTLASCGLLGGLLAYLIVLGSAPQDTAGAYAVMRQSIAAISNYLLLPSLAVALITGLLSMAATQPFLERRWVWVKAVLGISMFEGTLAIIGSKADYAAKVSAKIAAGEAQADALSAALAYEWQALGVITALSVANIVLGVWRPGLRWERSVPRPVTPVGE